MSNNESTMGKACCGPDCCGGEKNKTAAVAVVPDVRDAVREGYAQIASTGVWSSVQAAPVKTSGCCGGATASSGGGGCCGPTTLTAEQVALAVGYGQGELAALPEGANLGLSCGNPGAIAALKPGETVLDLGSGAGFDCFLAGPRVGTSGRVIGVDMTAAMVSKARANIASYRASSGLDNVEFRLGEIESIPVADASVDVVISNCVLNLSPDKPRVWKEIARVLKPGGRVAVSDLALLKPLPEAVLRDVEALVGCVAGACLIDEMRDDMQAAGLREISIVSKPEYIEAMTNWADPLYVKIIAALPKGTKVSEYVTSADVTARR